MDFAKAFDCVSVPKLIHKLAAIGITDPLLSCIASILNGRQQSVRGGHSLSAPQPVKSGVAQGSVLGSTLFILFVNDLESNLPANSISKFFADDLKSYIKFDSVTSLHDFSHLILAIENWSKAWQLSVEKCTWMILSNKINKYEYSFNMSGVKLSESTEVNDLGVLFNSTLNFACHINSIISKAKQRLFLLRKSFVNSNDDILILAFKTYVLPLLEYCSPVWSPSTVTHVLQIETVQRSFTKSLNSCYGLQYKDRLNKCGLHSLERRRLIADSSFCTKLFIN